MKQVIIILSLLFVFGMVDGTVMPWIISTDLLPMPLQLILIMMLAISTLFTIKLSWKYFNEKQKNKSTAQKEAKVDFKG